MTFLLGFQCWSFFEDTHSLSYNFTVDLQPGRRQLWCEVQGQVDGEVFLSYDCVHAQIIFTSLLGEEVKTTEAWERQVETLRDIRDWIKEQLHDFMEKRMARDPLTLQARMTCCCEDDRHISGSWQFGLNGLMSLHFDSEDGHWRVDHPGGRWMKVKWENDKAVTDFLKKVSIGDCRAWLQAFMVHWEEMLKTTASPTTVPPTLQTTVLPTEQPTAPAISHVTWIAPWVLASFVIMGIIAWILYKKSLYCGAPACLLATPLRMSRGLWSRVCKRLPTPSSWIWESHTTPALH
ncbi:UL16-binding protein 1-like isoform X2 [Oryx dammah]|uniref:UL16-binding protein 1-like isoform X2 n=1 Tax=Oryx dammah TaxID=59534 RepID=UPI001A9BB8CF|nr:UL16-binding protein 1-like isoform X2 [Oryx dammah]